LAPLFSIFNACACNCASIITLHVHIFKKIERVHKIVIVYKPEN
jgi:hypothetical protein